MKLEEDAYNTSMGAPTPLFDEQALSNFTFLFDLFKERSGGALPRWW